MDTPLTSLEHLAAVERQHPGDRLIRHLCAALREVIKERLAASEQPGLPESADEDAVYARCVGASPLPDKQERILRTLIKAHAAGLPALTLHDFGVSDLKETTLAQYVAIVRVHMKKHGRGFRVLTHDGPRWSLMREEG